MLKKMFSGYEIFICNGLNSTKKELFSFLKEIDNLNYIELIINCIDLDDIEKVYNLSLVEESFSTYK